MSAVVALRASVVVDQLVWLHEDHTSPVAWKGMVHGYTGQVAARVLVHRANKGPGRGHVGAQEVLRAVRGCPEVVSARGLYHARAGVHID